MRERRGTQAGATAALPDLRAFLIRGLAGSAGFKMLNMALGLGVTVLVARTLGAEGYGLYAFAYALVTVLAIPAHAGLPILVTREVAKYQLREDWAHLKGLLRRANQLVLAFSAILMIGTPLLFHLTGAAPNGLEGDLLLVALLLVPLVALGKVRAAALAGLRKVVQAQLPELLIVPALLLVLFSGALQIFAMTPLITMTLHNGAVVVAVVAGVVLLRREIPGEARAVDPAYETRAWARSMLPVSLIAGMQIVTSQTGLVLLGLFNPASDVGLYRVAVQGANVVSVSLMVINAVIAPQISRLHHAGDVARLQSMITWSARVALAAALPIAAVIFVFGADILNVAFGAEFTRAYGALAVLTTGQLISTLSGSVALLLNMTGNEDATAKALFFSAALSIAVSLILIPPWGILGAALGTAFGTMAWNLVLLLQVRRRLGISSLALRF